MAYAIVSSPGTEFGPCITPPIGHGKAECSHTDCAYNRDTARKSCRYCKEPIGYERRYSSNLDGEFAHWACAVDAAELNRKQRNDPSFGGHLRP